jgi:hypothetical protein
MDAPQRVTFKDDISGDATCGEHASVAHLEARKWTLCYYHFAFVTASTVTQSKRTNEEDFLLRIVVQLRLFCARLRSTSTMNDRISHSRWSEQVGGDAYTSMKIRHSFFTDLMKILLNVESRPFTIFAWLLVYNAVRVLQTKSNMIAPKTYCDIRCQCSYPVHFAASPKFDDGEGRRMSHHYISLTTAVISNIAASHLPVLYVSTTVFLDP